MRIVGLLSLLIVALAGPAGCGKYEPFDPPVTDEIPDGPGLFTGAAGAWVIYGSDQD